MIGVQCKHTETPSIKKRPAALGLCKHSGYESRADLYIQIRIESNMRRYSLIRETAAQFSNSP